jgi:hypothetical protein
VRALAALLLGLVVAQAQDRDPALLREQGLRGDALSLGAYLRALYPDERTQRLAAALVERLGEKTSFRRDEAVLRLAALRTTAVPELRRVADSDDPEVRRLARQLIRRSLRSVRRDVLLAVLRTVKRDRVAGLVHELLGVAPLAADLRLLSEVEDALTASVRPVDVPGLRAGLEAGDHDARATAVLGLGAALDPGALGELHLLLENEAEQVRLAAAWALADRGERTGLATFGVLLDAEGARVRARAARALRHISGETFGYTPYAGPPVREEAAAAWRKWIAANKETVRWELPMARGPVLLGRTLISIYRKNRVIEVEGEVVWRRDALPGYLGSVQRLANRNTLIAMGGPNTNVVAEMRPDGSHAWEARLGGPPTDARMLDNGHILVALGQQNKVVEIDRSGKVLWKLEGLRHPWSAQRLPNGNTLVCELGRVQVQEYSREGRVVWSCSANGSYSAQRLPNGRTLLADRSGVRELDRNGKAHWLLQSPNRFLRASQY